MVDPSSPSLCSNDYPGGTASTGPRVALAHDWIVAHRGGERVLAAIADALPNPPVHLYTMFHNQTPITPAIDACPTTVSALNAWPEGLRRWLLPRYPAAVRELSARLAEHHSLNPIDLLVSTSSVAIKALRPPPGVPHVCYCHTPARYLWSQADAYATPGVKGRLRAAGLAAFRTPLRRWDRDSAPHVTEFIANSVHTRDEIRRVYDRDAEVLYPPVRTDYFTPDDSVAREDFLLIVSALEPYKRVEHAIDAAARAGRPLVIIGTGSHEHALRRHAARSRGPSVRFLGRADDASVRDHMRRAHAFLMPQTEDFGITTVEAQSCGTPVAALGAGGALDTVLDGRTGALALEPTARSLADAVDRISRNRGDFARDCRTHALTFSEARFRTGILEILARYHGVFGIRP